MNRAAVHLDELVWWFVDLPTHVLDSQAGEDFARLLVAMGAVAEEFQSEDPGYSR